MPLKLLPVGASLGDGLAALPTQQPHGDECGDLGVECRARASVTINSRSSRVSFPLLDASSCSDSHGMAAARSPRLCRLCRTPCRACAASLQLHARCTACSCE